MVDVVVLPCVPATHRAFRRRVMSPSTSARLRTTKPRWRKNSSCGWSAGMAGVYTTSVAFGSMKAAGRAATRSSVTTWMPSASNPSVTRLSARSYPATRKPCALK